MRKNIIVTGGTRGIGRAIVEEIAQEYNVIFTYLKSKEEAQKLENLHHNVIGIQCDISSPEEVKNLGKYLKEKLELEENETKFFMLCLGMLVILSMKKDINKYREAKLQPLLLAMINDYNDETGETCKKLLEKINEKLDLSFKFD